MYFNVFLVFFALIVIVAQIILTQLIMLRGILNPQGVYKIAYHARGEIVYISEPEYFLTNALWVVGGGLVVCQLAINFFKSKNKK